MSGTPPPVAQSVNPDRTWRDRLVAAWSANSPWLVVLRPISVVYGALVALRAWSHRCGWRRSETPPVPTIVVGNVIAGGAGKTPTVLAIVEHLKQRGHRPGIVSRGYGRRQHHAVEVNPLHHTEDAVGDEPLLLAQRSGVPVVVGAQRMDAIRVLLAAHPDVTVAISDDGLQHWALRAHIGIAVFDDRGTGNGQLLPEGPLREPWPRTQGPTVDWVIYSGTPPTMPPGMPAFASTRALAAHAVNAFGATFQLDDWRNHRVAAVAGIARPGAFFDMLRLAGLTLHTARPLHDHATYTDADVQSLADLARTTPVLLTEKDAVKVFPVLRRWEPGHPPADWTANVWAVPLVVSLEAAFWSALDEKLSSLHGPQTA